MRLRKYLVKLKKIPLSTFDLQDFTQILKIPYFRGVFMKDSLPKNPFLNESDIVNLDVPSGSGTDWVCYYKIRSLVDSCFCTSNRNKEIFQRLYNLI